MEKRFEGRAAVITGAASGMGLLCCKRLAAEGANVVMMDVNGEALEGFAAEINALGGGKAIPFKSDIRNYEEVEAAVKLCLEKFGRIDITASFAGGSSQRVLKEFKPFDQMSIPVMDWGIDVNLKGPMYLARAAINPMMEAGRGVIVNIGSETGIVGASDADYAAAKSGLLGFTKAVALIGAPHNVRCVCVSPGPVLTREAMAKCKTPLGRAAEPDELINVVLFLASDEASYVTGDNLTVDGGAQCGWNR